MAAERVIEEEQTNDAPQNAYETEDQSSSFSASGVEQPNIEEEQTAPEMPGAEDLSDRGFPGSTDAQQQTAPVIDETAREREMAARTGSEVKVDTVDMDQKTAAPELQPDELNYEAIEMIQGKYGNGKENRLNAFKEKYGEEHGQQIYDQVQDKVNEYMHEPDELGKHRVEHDAYEQKMQDIETAKINDAAKNQEELSKVYGNRDPESMQRNDNKDNADYRRQQAQVEHKEVTADTRKPAENSKDVAQNLSDRGYGNAADGLSAEAVAQQPGKDQSLVADLKDAGDDLKNLAKQGQDNLDKAKKELQKTVDGIMKDKNMGPYEKAAQVENAVMDFDQKYTNQFMDNLQKAGNKYVDGLQKVTEEIAGKENVQGINKAIDNFQKTINGKLDLAQKGTNKGLDAMQNAYNKNGKAMDTAASKVNGAIDKVQELTNKMFDNKAANILMPMSGAITRAANAVLDLAQGQLGEAKKEFKAIGKSAKSSLTLGLGKDGDKKLLNGGKNGLEILNPNANKDKLIKKVAGKMSENGKFPPASLGKSPEIGKIISPAAAIMTKATEKIADEITKQR